MIPCGGSVAGGGLTQQDVLDILNQYPGAWLTTRELATLMRVVPTSGWRCCKRLHAAGFLVRKVVGNQPINGVPIIAYQAAPGE